MYVVSSILNLLMFVMEQKVSGDTSIEEAADENGDSPILPCHVSYWALRVCRVGDRLIALLGIRNSGKPPPDLLARAVYYLRLSTQKSTKMALVCLKRLVYRYCRATGHHFF